MRKDGLGDLAMNAKRNQLLAEKSVLGDQVRLGACEIGNSTEHDRMAGRLSEMKESLFKKDHETAEQWGQPMEEDEHVVRLSENCQKLSTDCIWCSNRVKL